MPQTGDIKEPQASDTQLQERLRAVLGPSEGEVAAWSEREQKYRARKPTRADCEAWAEREYRRRLAEAAEEALLPPYSGAEVDVMARRMQRTAELVGIGTWALLMGLPARFFSRAVQEGLNWQEDFFSRRRRPRVMPPEGGEAP